MKRFTSFILVIVLVFVEIFTLSPKTILAKNGKTALSRKKITLKVGKKKTIKLKNAKKRVKWKVIKGKKVVRITKISGKRKNVIKIKGRKAGTAQIKVKCGKKTYKVRIRVNNPTKEGHKVPATKPEEKTTSEEETTLAPVKYATVKFDTDGGPLVDDMICEIGKPYGELPDLQWESSGTLEYSCLGWFTEYRSGKRIRETDICTGDITLYAFIIAVGGDISHDHEKNLYVE
ncbi:MAG: InlB B-repeat-containing protein [Eubacterium sp.]|nr:InlB B-repeat-containing protein [Eubacterium sp.]